MRVKNARGDRVNSYCLCNSGISKFAVLYTLSKQAKSLGAFKLARHVLDKINGLRIPKRFKGNVDLASLMIREFSFKILGSK